MGARCVASFCPLLPDRGRPLGPRLDRLLHATPRRRRRRRDPLHSPIGTVVAGTTQKLHVAAGVVTRVPVAVMSIDSHPMTALAFAWSERVWIQYATAIVRTLVSYVVAGPIRVLIARARR